MNFKLWDVLRSLMESPAILMGPVWDLNRPSVLVIVHATQAPQ